MSNHLRIFLRLLRPLRLRSPPKLLGAILPLLPLLPTRLLNLGREPIPHQPIMRLELLQRLRTIIDEGKSRALAAAILRAEAKHRYRVLGRLVEFGEFVAEIVFGDVRAVWVQHVDNHLLAAEERIADEFTRAEGDLAFGHFGGLEVVDGCCGSLSEEPHLLRLRTHHLVRKPYSDTGG